MRVIGNTQEMNTIVRNAGMSTENASPSELRRGVILGTSESIVLDFKSNVANKLVSDQLVDISDAFIVTGIGFALFTLPTATPTDALIMKAVRHQFANPYVFTGTNAKASTPAIYNASAKITSNTNTLYPRLPMKFLERVPENQQGMPLVYQSTGDVVHNSLRSSAEPNGFYCIPVKPVTLKGNESLDINIDLKTSLVFADSSITNYAEVVLRGYYINDGASS